MLPVIVVLALALLLCAVSPALAQTKLEDFEVGNYPLGGDFHLTNQHGGRTRLKDLQGKVVLMAFGYTHCPDVCPTTLALFKMVKQGLGPQGQDLAAVFISVDPKRDTPALLKRYVGSFDPDFLGLTGNAQQLAAVTDQYMAKFRIRETNTPGAYAVDHTTLIYLIDGQGKVRYLFTRDVSRDVIVAGCRKLLAARFST